MSEPRSGRKGGPDKSSLQGELESVAELEDRVELTVKLRNPADQALHYISDVRAINVDPATGRVRVRLSERGLEIPLGGTFVLPRVRMVDPHGEASLTVSLPKTIVKLSSAPSPDGEVTFEEHPIAGAPEIRVEIGWSETPYYADRREGPDQKNPVAAWEQAQLRVTSTDREAELS